MGDLFRMFVDWIQLLWPLHRIEQWEVGGYYEGGKFVKILPPGLWLLVPWFTEIHNVSVVPDIVWTSRLDITLSDGEMLTFVAEGDYIVTDPAKAMNAVNDYHHRTSEIMAGVLSAELAQKSLADVEAGVRKRLLTSLIKSVNAQTTTFGVEMKSIWFTTFITGLKAYRFVGDAATPWS